MPLVKGVWVNRTFLWHKNRMFFLICLLLIFSKKVEKIQKKKLCDFVKMCDLPAPPVIAADSAAQSSRAAATHLQIS